MSTVLQAAPIVLPEGISVHEIEQYAKLDVAIKKLQPKHKVLNDKIKKAFLRPGTWIIGNVIIKRTTAKTFDLAAASKRYPESRYPEFYKTVFDPDKFPADQKAKFQVPVERLSVEVAIPVEDEEF